MPTAIARQRFNPQEAPSPLWNHVLAAAKEIYEANRLPPSDPPYGFLQTMRDLGVEVALVENPQDHTQWLQLKKGRDWTEAEWTEYKQELLNPFREQIIKLLARALEISKTPKERGPQVTQEALFGEEVNHGDKSGIQGGGQPGPGQYGAHMPDVRRPAGGRKGPASGSMR